ncbi:hypothetical protein EDB19DRAFT_1981214 [Suillus lakei]|nr:hypothetical protein EDB19DRAFT_1981214 [Suillus lakei]
MSQFGFEPHGNNGGRKSRLYSASYQGIPSSYQAPLQGAGTSYESSSIQGAAYESSSFQDDSFLDNSFQDESFWGGTLQQSYGPYSVPPLLSTPQPPYSSDGASMPIWQTQSALIRTEEIPSLDVMHIFSIQAYIMARHHEKVSNALSLTHGKIVEFVQDSVFGAYQLFYPQTSTMDPVVYCQRHISQALVPTVIRPPVYISFAKLDPSPYSYPLFLQSTAINIPALLINTDIMIQDLALTRPFTEVAAHICYPDNPVIKDMYRSHLFINHQNLFNTDQLSATMSRHSIPFLSSGLGVNSWHHISTTYKCKLGWFMEKLLEDNK